MRVQKYYKNWILTSNPLLSEHDIYKFYQFVKVVLKSSGSRFWNGPRLRYFLERDLNEKYQDKDYMQIQIRNAISIFDHLKDYEKVSRRNRDIEQELIEPMLQRRRERILHQSNI